jgi:hypothetical protein
VKLLCLETLCDSWELVRPPDRRLQMAAELMWLTRSDRGQGRSQPCEPQFIYPHT